MPLRLFGALVACVLILSACAASGTTGDGAGPTPNSGPTIAASPVPGSEAPADAPVTSVPSAEDPTAEDPLVGTVGGGSLEGGCMWLDTADGERYELIPAPDSQVAIDPANLVIAETDGTVIAAAGDTVSVSGQIDPGMVSFCQVGTILLVEDVSAG